MNYLEYRWRLELPHDAYHLIDVEARALGLAWFASPWDLPSLEFLLTYPVPAVKVASACLTDIAFLEEIRASGRPAILSTGMSTERQIKRAVAALGPDRLILLWCRSNYPCPPSQLNLLAIRRLAELFPLCPVGYSGHETGLWTTLCAVVLGAVMVERHFTLDRASFGTDQAASLEPPGLAKLVQQIRRWEQARGTGELGLIPEEQEALAKLRRVP